jgi:hypothetical protein
MSGDSVQGYHAMRVRSFQSFRFLAVFGNWVEGLRCWDNHQELSLRLIRTCRNTYSSQSEIRRGRYLRYPCFVPTCLLNQIVTKVSMKDKARGSLILIRS